MRQTLIIHPDSRCAAVTAITVGAARPRPRQLVLHYVMTGRVDEVRLPPLAAPARTDDLWRHTCFEAFVRAPSGNGYLEFNFAPSTQWAAYRFDGYREGMAIAGNVPAPHIEVTAGAARVEMQVLLELPYDAPWRLGLSAVIEQTGGAKSYWALAHPPGRPDFHHADCFALELAAI